MNIQINVTACGSALSAELLEELAQAMVFEMRRERCRVIGRNLDDVLTQHQRHDIGHEIVLAERAREDHR